MISFIECNPNPIIEISKQQKAITSMNPAARVQFPMLEKEGLNHPILYNLYESIMTINDKNSRLTLMVKEVLFRKTYYEQQVFTVEHEDSIFVYMSNITHYREIEASANHYIKNFKKIEEEYKLKLQAAHDELKNSFNIFNQRRQQEQLALKAANIATWNWHIPCDVVIWDEYMGNLLGLDPAINSGGFDTLLNAIHPQDREKVSVDLENAWHNNTVCYMQFRVIKPDGSVHHVCLKGKSYADTGGTPVGLTGVCFMVASG